MTFEKRVYEQEFKLNDTDDSVIEYIKENRNNLSNISIHNIAGTLFVSPNAIMRTAKKLGYSGFSELKFSLQTEDSPSDMETVEKRVLDRIPQNIVKTLDVIEQDEIEKIVSCMLKTNKILFIGVGDSVYFCEMFGKNLRCLDRKVEYYGQIHDMEYSASHCDKGDMIIIISASGTNARINKIAKDAKSKEIDVFCLTHYGKNPLSEECDGQLCFWGEKRLVGGYNVTDRSGLMMLIRMICEEYWKKFCV